MKKKTITLLVGPPAVGKSTFIEKYIQEHQEEKISVACFDDIVSEVATEKSLEDGKLFILPTEEEIKKHKYKSHPKYGKVILVRKEWGEAYFVFEKIEQANDEILRRFVDHASSLKNHSDHILVDLPLLAVSGFGGRKHVVEIISGHSMKDPVNAYEYLCENFNVDIVEFRNINAIKALVSQKPERMRLFESMESQGLNGSQRSVLSKEISKHDKKLFNAFLPNITVSSMRAFNIHKRGGFKNIPPESFFSMFCEYSDPKESKGTPGSCELFDVRSYTELPLTHDTFLQRIEDKLKKMSKEDVLDLKDFICSFIDKKYRFSVLSIIDSVIKKSRHPASGICRENINIIIKEEKEDKKMDIFCSPSLALLH